MATAKRAITVDRIQNTIKRGDYSAAIHMCKAIESPLRKIIEKKQDELNVIAGLRRLACSKQAAEEGA